MPGPPRFVARTAEEARGELVKLLRQYRRGEVTDPVIVRTMIYGLSKLLDYFRFNKETEIVERIDALEKKIEMISARVSTISGGALGMAADTQGPK